MKINKKDELKKYYIKMIHTLKHNYFVDDECRKVYLQAEFGKDSLKDLNIDELRKVLAVVGYKSKFEPKFRRNGAKDTAVQTGGVPREIAKKDPLKATQKQLDTIVGIWNRIARVKTGLALRLFIERITGRLVFCLWYLSRQEATDVIIALRKMQGAYFDSK